MTQRLRHHLSRIHRPILIGWVVTRQGALVAARSMLASRARPPTTRLAMVAAGSVLIGLGISLYLHARLGLPPYDVLLSSIVARTGLTHGQAGWAVSGGLILLATLLGRRPSIYGLVFVIANGASVDAWTHLLVDPSGLGTRVLFVGLGIIAIAGGVATVAHSSSTGGPFELLTGAASDRGLNPTLFRSGLELATVSLGVGLGGQLGFGTLAFVVTIGPAISFLVQALADRQTGRTQRLETAKETSEKTSVGAT
jgi:uncharacterized membrane protein YczE